MTILVDSDETSPVLIQAADRQENLDVPGTDYSYDVEVIHDGEAFTFERKEWNDYIQSFFDESLPRQVSYVDALIVERPSKLDEMSSRWSEETIEAASKRLDHLSWLMPVFVKQDVGETVELLEYVERKGVPDLRPNEVEKLDEEVVRRKVLAVLPYINVQRRLDSGNDLGERLERLVDWDGVAEALNLPEWKTLPGIGAGTVRRIREEL